jgi:hypothetical protein
MAGGAGMTRTFLRLCRDYVINGAFWLWLLPQPKRRAVRRRIGL